MLKRTLSALVCTNYTTETSPAIVALIDFAAQSPGIDPRNYASDWRDREGVKAYRSEVRQVTNDWKRTREALHDCATAGATDADVIEASKSAYSGRLTWNGSAWDYCTGQYFPTEYRKACYVTLERAAMACRAKNPKARQSIASIAELRELAHANGSHWFDKSSMRFFNTRIESGIINGNRFVTSEVNPSGQKAYSVRQFDDKANIKTVGQFHSISTRREAMTLARAAE